MNNKYKKSKRNDYDNDDDNDDVYQSPYEQEMHRMNSADAPPIYPRI